MEISEINKLGKELEIYTTVDYIGKGFPIILPKGAKIIKIIKDYVEEEEEKNGYKFVRTPSASKAEIYTIEDRYESEKDLLFKVNAENDEEHEDNTIVLKPYSQPFHCSVYNTKQHTYKELPIKYSETSTIFRNEKDAKGITKARQFTLSDISIFAKRENVQKEIKDAIEMQENIIKSMQLDVVYTVETWNDEKKEEYIGQVEEWKYLTECMKNALDALNIKYTIDNKARMYGPAILIKYNDRDFSTLQVDFEIVHRFNVKYVNNDNEDEFPIYLHMTTIGSYENILSILIEKYEGDFPFWLAPTQVLIITEGEEFDDYAKELQINLEKHKIRAEIDNSINNFQNKEYRAIDLKIPFIVSIEKKNFQNKKVRIRTKKEIKECKVEEFMKEVLDCQAKF